MRLKHYSVGLTSPVAASLFCESLSFSSCSLFCFSLQSKPLALFFVRPLLFLHLWPGVAGRLASDTRHGFEGSALKPDQDATECRFNKCGMACCDRLLDEI